MTNKEFFINSWKQWAASLAKGIRALPADNEKLIFTHHPNFRSPWELVNHIAPHSREIFQGATQGRIDLVNEGKFDINAPHIYKSTEEAAKDVEENSAKMLAALERLDDSTWENQKIPTYWGPMKMMELTLSETAWMLHNNMIYHLGQLTSYYRKLGVQQPNLYGPTYEEEMAMMAQAGAN